MELHELADRIFRLHAKLIIAFLLIGLAGGLALQWHAKPKYQADAQLVIGAEDPQSAQNAAVLADTARAIATGPELVSRAISRAGVTRSEAEVAAGINVQSLGSSGVLVLSVTDPDPRVATQLANSLAAGVVRTRSRLADNGIKTSMASLRAQEAATRKQINQLTSQTDTIAGQLASTPLLAEAPVVAQLTALESRLTSLQDQATQIALQRSQLSAQQGPTAAVLDTASTAASTGGRGLVEPVLGALLGLVVGIALAAIAEMARPHLVGAEAISRAIGTPLLGEMSTPPDRWTLASLPDAGSYIELAAESQHVREVKFAALDPNGQHRSRMLMLASPVLRPAAKAARDGTRDGARDGENSGHTGLVVAVPRVLKAADIDAVTNYMWISGWTLLGVIAFPARRGWGAAVSKDAPVGKDAPVSKDTPVSKDAPVNQDAEV